ncbi:MAG: non-canonical purine NTP pyrophosphatase [Candidatus Micrarchaeota archaeon]
MKLLFATTNPGKFREAADAVKERGLQLEQANIEIEEPKLLELEKTAERKAQLAFNALGRPVVVEDTGVFFDEYPLFPGTYSKFAVKTLGIPALLKLLEGGKRGARFATIAAYCDGKTTNTFEGEARGTILETPEGKSRPGLAYDSVFKCDGGGKTFAQMTVKEKNEHSHRTKAFRKLAKWLARKEA